MKAINVLPLVIGLVHAFPGVTPTPTITPAPLPRRAYAANFIGWRSWSQRGDLTSYQFQQCTSSLSYATSVFSGTTYGQCCDVGNDDCATSTFALSCVSNQELAGSVTLRDCGTMTCNNALIYQNYGDKTDPIYFHGCQNGARGGTYYRTMPPNALNTLTTTFTPTSSPFSSTHHGFSGGLIAAIIIPLVIFVAMMIVMATMCIRSSTWARRRQQRKQQVLQSAPVAVPAATTIPPNTSHMSSNADAIQSSPTNVHSGTYTEGKSLRGSDEHPEEQPPPYS